MRPWNPYSLDRSGSVIIGQTPVRLVVYGPELTPPQSAALQTAFVTSQAMARLSLVPNPSFQGALFDGSRYTIDHVAGSCTCAVWPAGGIEDCDGYVYIGSSWENDVTEFAFERRGGVVSCTTRSFPRFSYEEHPFSPYGGWALGIYRHYAGLSAYGVNLFDAGKVGVFGSKRRFFLDYNIVRLKEILKELSPNNYYQSPRRYGGLGYVAFVVSGKSVRQDDGTEVFTAPPEKTIRSVSFHPTSPRMSLIENSYLESESAYGYEWMVVRGEVDLVAYYQKEGNLATYVPRLQLKGFGGYTATRRELVLQGGAWVEESAEDVSPIASPSSEIVFDAKDNSYYLRTVSSVSGIVNYTKDVPYYTNEYTIVTMGGGTCELEASYKHSHKNNSAQVWYGQSGKKSKVTQGWDKEYSFSGSRWTSYDRYEFQPFELDTKSTSKSRSWYEIDGARLYTLDSEVELSLKSGAIQSKSPDGNIDYADYGNHTGSARMHVKCQRRELLQYDPEHRFLCYIEEKEFEYLWEPTASCTMMKMYGGENSQPYNESLLLGTDAMVPVGQPVYYLVMKIGEKEVLRKELVLKVDPFILRSAMIPVTSIYLQPEVAALPSDYISVEEYTRRTRTLLCTGYQFYAQGKLLSPKDTIPKYRENRLYVGPFVEGRRLDDCFLRFGAFPEIPRITTEYIADSATQGGVLLLLPEDSVFALPNTAFVVANGAVDERIVPTKSRSLSAT